MKVLKKYLPDILIVVAFAILSFAYFMPADIDGRILYRNDSSAGVGAGRETELFQQQTGEHSRWTNAIFSGMPTYQLSPSYDSTSVLSQATKLYHLWLPDNVWYVFAYLLGFYILMRAVPVRRSVALMGAVAWAFSSYFLIIIAAGHIWKVMALAYLPPMIAGIVLAYRGRYLAGFVLTALFGAFEILSNHVQMTYYYMFIILFMLIAYLVQAIREKEMARFGKATLTCLAGGIIAVGLNLSNLYHTWEYGQESMRGKSELVKKASSNQTSSGLDRDYITQWSYGIDETWTLLVPDVMGGASVPLSHNETAMKKASADVENMLPGLYDQIPQYWGTQPGTSGPVYVGAFVLFLFVLSLFIVKGPLKWALLAATVLSVTLSWGRNFMWLTNLFLDYVPMYAKFRTVASILVIAEFTIPVLAVMGLCRIIAEPKVLKIKSAPFIISFLLTAGVCLLFAVMPALFFGFSNAEEENMFHSIKGMTPDAFSMITGSIKNMREAMMTADAWRSFFIILAGTALLFLYKKGKLQARYMAGAVAVLCLVDMWAVDKRYLNDGMFVEKSVREAGVPMTETDRQILRDRSLDYRVLNMASNTFNESETSYWHKSIGGYHPAKLQRYQDLIDAYISPEMRRFGTAFNEARGDMSKVKGDSIFPVLNMLNTKYIIIPVANNQTAPLQNPYAYGNAWIVDNIKYVGNANEELSAVGKTDLRHEAVADSRFKETLGHSKPQDQTSLVKITSYKPNNLTYDVSTGKGGTVVFSEIYYPGWTATVDGKPAELGRVDYVLRALTVGPGHHKVVLDFHPKSVKITETVAYCGYVALILVVAIGIWSERRRKNSAAAEKEQTAE